MRAAVLLLLVWCHIVQLVAAAATYQYVGCFTDSTARILPNLFRDEQNMTVDSCASYASGASLSYFGVEYGSQCIAGNSLVPSSVSSGCTYVCKGNALQICGGYYATSVYHTSSSTTTTTTTSPFPGAVYVGCFADTQPRVLSGSVYTSDYMTLESCAYEARRYAYFGVEYGSQCFMGNSITSSNPSFGCNMRCGGNSEQVCGGVWAVNVYRFGTPTTTTSTTTTITVLTSTTYLGCFADRSEPRILSYQIYQNDAMTKELCAAEALQGGYEYFGLEYGVQCQMGHGISSSVRSTGCNLACGGNSDQICGGVWAINVYKFGGGATETIPYVAPGTFYLGCFSDGTPRILSYQIYQNDGMTIDMCAIEASHSGYKYFGVEYGVQCQMGHTLTSSNPSTACNMKCGGNSEQTCGGPWAINIYGFGENPSSTVTATKLSGGVTSAETTSISVSNPTSSMESDLKSSTEATFSNTQPIASSTTLTKTYSSTASSTATAESTYCPTGPVPQNITVFTMNGVKYLIIQKVKQKIVCCALFTYKGYHKIV
ncbi:WSC domain-containing protein [Obelidium mucronatum]|nr:WSC domain-containing protein [Obelidium mucronatum]